MRAQLEDCARARRRARVPLGVGGDDLRAVRLRARVALTGGMSLSRERVAFAQPFEPRGTLRLVVGRGGARALPAAVRAVTTQRPGDVPAVAMRGGRRGGCRRSGERAGRPKNRVLLELDGKPAGYAIYTREAGVGAGGVSRGRRERSSRRSRPSRRPRASCGAGCSTSTGRRRSSPTCCRSTTSSSYLLAEPRRMRFDVDRRCVGAGARRRGGARGAHVRATARSRSRSPTTLLPGERRDVERQRGERRKSVVRRRYPPGYRRARQCLSRRGLVRAAAARKPCRGAESRRLRAGGRAVLHRRRSPGAPRSSDALCTT